MIDEYDEHDVISKLLDRSNEESPSADQEERSHKTLQEELMDVGETLSKSSLGSSNSEKKEKTEPHSRTTKKDFKLINVLLEFMQLSAIMDQQIAVCRAKFVTEQKQGCPSRDKGKMEILKELLLDQYNDAKKRNENNKMSLLKQEDVYRRKLTSLENVVEHHQNSNKQMQREFNQMLDKKEQEIEEMMAENAKLQNELLKKNDDDMALENEELEEKIEIKNDYISTLRLQISMLERQHEQDEWKSRQADDLLEMVETERDDLENKYKILVTKLSQSQLKYLVTSSKNEHNSKSPNNSLFTAHASGVKFLNKTPAKFGFVFPSNNVQLVSNSNNILPFQEMPNILKSLRWSDSCIISK